MSATMAPESLWHDHVAHSVPDLDAAAARLTQLGFTLAPRSNQLGAPSPGAALVPTGVANCCVMLRRGYLEITGAVMDTPAAAAVKAAVARHVGLHLLALGSPSPETQGPRLEAAGFGPASFVRTQRMIGTEDGEALARFSLVTTPREHMPEARLPMVRQDTPELVWQPRWLGHANGALGLEEVVAVVPDLDEAAARFARFLGIEAARSGGVARIALARGGLTLMTAAAAKAFFPVMPAPPCLAGYVIAVPDVGPLAMFLAERGVQGEWLSKDCLAVTGGDALGAVQVFVSEGAALPW